MKYIQPYGSTDPNAAYVDRNTPGAIAGSRVPAAAIEHPQREIMAVIAAAGLAPDSADLTQLLQAIHNLIDAATGGAGDASYVLMNQARNRLPIFPDVTGDGRLAVISPSVGTVRIMPGYNFLHRGIFNVTTVQQDFFTAASKIYHLRWNPSDGFALNDVASMTYNPAGLSEDNAAFDTTYDDMLIAKVVTNQSNVATITTLANKSDLSINQVSNFTSQIVNPGSDGAYAVFTIPYNWARTPKIYDINNVSVASAASVGEWVIMLPDGSAEGYNLNRYQINQRYRMYQVTRLVIKYSARA